MLSTKSLLPGHRILDDVAWVIWNQVPLCECNSDLFQVLFVVCGDLVEFSFECSGSGFAMDEFQMSTFLVMHPRLINDPGTNSFVDAAREIERRLRIVEPFGPRSLIECPQYLFWLTDDATNSVI